MSTTIQDLLNARCSGQGIDRDLQRRMEGLPKHIRANLAQWGLLAERTLAAMKPLTELLAGYADSLRARERTEKYVEDVVTVVTEICDGCGFVFFADIDAGKVETYFKRRREDGLSFCRSNTLLTYVKGFVKWCFDSGFTSELPLRTLKPLNAKEDRRRVRRVLEIEDVKRLIAATAAAKARHGLTGYERALVYSLALTTGLRSNEIRTLPVSAFHWDTLTIELAARNEKNRKGNTLPLRADVADELKTYLAGKPPTAKAFAGMTSRTGDMVKDDLREAGIPFTDEEGRPFDFHSLRHQFGTMLAAAGVHPRDAMELMRHHSVELTMGLYSHVLRGQTCQAVAKLPGLSVEQEQAVIRTGTDGEILSVSCLGDSQSQTPIHADTQRTGSETHFQADNREPARMGHSLKSAGAAAPYPAQRRGAYQHGWPWGMARPTSGMEMGDL
jgi:integrase